MKSFREIYELSFLPPKSINHFQRRVFMKTKISVLLSVFLVAGFCAQICFAQAQEQKPQLFMIYDVIVKPATVAGFEAAAKGEWALAAEGKSPYPWNTYSSDDLHYYFLSPLNNYTDVDTMDSAGKEMRKKLGEERFKANDKAYDGTFEYLRIGFISLRPDLSYAPEKPALKPEEANCLYWGLCYVEPGKEEEFEKVLKEYVALYKSKNVALGFTTYEGGFGNDLPFYFYAMSGKSSADIFSEDEKATKIVGEEKIKELWNKTLATLRKYEFKTGRYRPDLSYIPEATKPAK